jgi:hypothetical protein
MQPEGKLIGMASIRTIIFNPFILKNLEAELHSNETFMGRYFIYEKASIEILLEIEDEEALFILWLLTRGSYQGACVCV